MIRYSIVATMSEQGCTENVCGSLDCKAFLDCALELGDANLRNLCSGCTTQRTHNRHQLPKTAALAPTTVSLFWGGGARLWLRDGRIFLARASLVGVLVDLWNKLFSDISFQNPFRVCTTYCPCVYVWGQRFMPTKWGNEDGIMLQDHMFNDRPPDQGGIVSV